MAVRTPSQMTGTGDPARTTARLDDPAYYDVALRDFGLVLAALTLTRPASAFPADGPGR